MQKKSFREDINGLRAIAVLSVVIFHFNKDYLPGGFAGVDVFFVISGYLMTSIIFRGIENKNFSIFNFIKSRAKRIIPALTAVIFLLLVIGFLCFEPLTYRIIGKHSVSSLLFISNYIYSLESGYFDLGSYDKFLLHTWSLSVEWQFYIVYPILLLILSKKTHLQTIKKIIILIAVCSFVLSVVYTESDPTSSYFMLYTRAWEMMLGGIAFLYPISHKIKNRIYIELTGIMLIIISFFIISESTLWPGYMASIPVIGGYLCILANNKKSILSNRALQKIGLWSYSIYLIHWPVVVFLHKMDIEANIFIFLIIVSVLSFSVYELVEKKRNYSYGMVVAYFVVLILAFYIKINGASWRLSNSEFTVTLQQFRNLNEGHAGLGQPDDVQYLNSDENSFDYILIGSSHARHYNSFILKNKIKVASFALDGCNSTKNQHYKEVGSNCDKVYEKTVNFIKKHHGKKIIWATRWDHWGAGKLRPGGVKSDAIEEINNFINDIKGTNSSLYIVSETPGASFVAFECLAKKDLIINKLFSFDCDSREEKKQSDFNKKILQTIKINENTFFIDTNESLCDEKSCMVIDNGIPIYTDYGHLSKHGADIVGNYIIEKINQQK
ncbi:acyltransferase [Morganella morganii subsp. morganii]|uniref:acyltransferase family protein n=1 Tax=Morganella morganii TaxID=582 RepID=UPI001BDA8588|nr:acyltransferase family protein [Morganella morganii]MBT0351384.1 acyltransferase [Morganella morganii subsp. morganii]